MKSDRKVCAVDVKNCAVSKVDGDAGKSPVGVSAVNAVIEWSVWEGVWEVQNTTRAIVACAEWVHNAVFEPGSAILAGGSQDKWSAGSKDPPARADGSKLANHPQSQLLALGIALCGPERQECPRSGPRSFVEDALDRHFPRSALGSCTLCRLPR